MDVRIWGLMPRLFTSQSNHISIIIMTMIIRTTGVIRAVNIIVIMIIIVAAYRDLFVSWRCDYCCFSQQPNQNPQPPLNPEP